MFNRACRLVTVAMVVSTGACVHGRGNVPRATANVLFTNESFDQADVYALLGSGARTRIGTVQSGRTDTLHLSRDVVGVTGSVTIVVRLTPSGRTASSGQVTLNTGETISVRMPSDGSTLIVLPAR